MTSQLTTAAMNLGTLSRTPLLELKIHEGEFEREEKSSFEKVKRVAHDLFFSVLYSLTCGYTKVNPREVNGRYLKEVMKVIDRSSKEVKASFKSALTEEEADSVQITLLSLAFTYNLSEYRDWVENTRVAWPIRSFAPLNLKNCLIALPLSGVILAQMVEDLVLRWLNLTVKFDDYPEWKEALGLDTFKFIQAASARSYIARIGFRSPPCFESREAFEEVYRYSPHLMASLLADHFPENVASLYKLEAKNHDLGQRIHEMIHSAHTQVQIRKKYVERAS